jgi:hypothetical protein
VVEVAGEELEGLKRLRGLKGLKRDSFKKLIYAYI